MFLKDSKNSGQALLIVLLSMSVVLVVVLYVVSRSIVDVSISKKSDDSMRAFSAAEAGIEQALIIGTGDSTGEIGGATFNSAVTDIGEGQTDYSYPLKIKSGDEAIFWFVAHDEDGNLGCPTPESCFHGKSIRLCWGNEGTSATTSTTPAIEATVYYTTTPNDLTTLNVTRNTFDPNVDRRAVNNFTSASVSTSGCDYNDKQYAFQRGIDFSLSGIVVPDYDTPGVLQFMKVRMLYNTTASHDMGLRITSSDSLLPSQGKEVTSSGSYGDTNRRIRVSQVYSSAPNVLDSVVYSPSGVTK